MDEQMMMAAMEQAMAPGAGAGQMPAGAAPAAPSGGEGLVTIQVPEFALPYIAEMLSSMMGAAGGGAPMDAGMGGAPMDAGMGGGMPPAGGMPAGPMPPMM